MKLRIHDPAHIALHRGIRATIGVPIAMALGILLLPGTPAALIAAFGVLVTVAIADFGGMRSEQVRSLGGMALAGAIVLTIGVLAGGRPWSAVLATFIVTVLLTYVVLLHGAVASGAPPVLIMYVVSVSLGVPLSELGPILGGWLIAMALALPLTLFVVPRRTTAPVRKAVESALAALADVARSRATGAPLDLDALRKAEADLQASYFGNPFRASGLSQRNHALQLLASQLQGFIAAITRGTYFTADRVDSPTTALLSEEAAGALAASSDALGDAAAPAPSGLAIAATWQGQWDEAVAVLSSDPDAVNRVDGMFPDRAFALATVRLTMLVRRVLGLGAEDYEPVLGAHTIPEPPMPSIRRELASQAHLRSPWARLALRAGVGVALAVLVVEMVGLAHGFWVMLGVVSVLRLDPSTTFKMGALAIGGTLLGAVVAILVIFVDDRNEPLLWILFVGAVFLATWAPGALGFTLGQAAFSLFVIIAFSLIAWPPDLATVEQRVLDICVGVVVGVVVAALMWPRGVMRGLMSNVADAIDSARGALVAGVNHLVTGTAPTSTHPGEAGAELARARDVVEMGVGSTNPQVVASAREWQALLGHLRTLVVAGHLLGSWAYERPPIDREAPQLGPPLQGECTVADDAWAGVSRAVRGQHSEMHDATVPGSRDVVSVARTVDLSAPEVADRALAAIWGHGWLRMTRDAAQACVVPGSSSR